MQRVVVDWFSLSLRQPLQKLRLRLFEYRPRHSERCATCNHFLFLFQCKSKWSDSDFSMVKTHRKSPGHSSHHHLCRASFVARSALSRFKLVEASHKNKNIYIYICKKQQIMSSRFLHSSQGLDVASPQLFFNQCCRNAVACSMGDTDPGNLCGSSAGGLSESSVPNVGGEASKPLPVAEPWHEI